MNETDYSLAWASTVFPSNLLSAPFFLSRPSKRNSDLGSHSRPFSPLRTVRALHFYREKISALTSLVDSRRSVFTRARRSQQLIIFLNLRITSKSHHGGIYHGGIHHGGSRTHGELNQYSPLDHRDDRFMWINSWTIVYFGDDIKINNDHVYSICESGVVNLRGIGGTLKFVAKQAVRSWHSALRWFTVTNAAPRVFVGVDDVFAIVVIWLVDTNENENIHRL